MGADRERYPVPVSDPFVRYEQRIQALERKVADLLGARPMQHTAMTAGRFSVIDQSGEERVRIGVVRSEDGIDKYGLIIADDGGVRFEVNGEDGFVVPMFPLTPIPQKQLGSGPYVVTTSATFESVYRAVSQTTHKAMTYRFVVVTAASTVGEVRVRHVGSGTTSGVISCAAGGQTNGLFQWLHDQPLGTGPHSFDLQARRVSGAGDVNVFWPDLAAMVAGQVSTPDGLPPFP